MQIQILFALLPLLMQYKSATQQSIIVAVQTGSKKT